MTNINISYRKYHRDKAYLENEKLFKNIFKKRLNIAKRFYDTHGIVLDIGASTGTMLDVFRENGWKTWGVEPSESSKEASKKGHKIINEFFERADLPKNYFDMVILNHTLEHMDDPVKVLKKIHTILKDNGIVYVDVPNAGGLGAKILKDGWPYRLPEEHRYQFTKESLRGVFKNSGFRVIHFESRSGIFEFADPVEEIWQSLITGKKRFFTNIVFSPYSLIATVLNMGDSMSMIGRK